MEQSQLSQDSKGFTISGAAAPVFSYDHIHLYFAKGKSCCCDPIKRSYRRTASVTSS